MGFFRYASGQTDRHTDTLIAILRTPTVGGEVITKNTRAAMRLTEQKPTFAAVLVMTTSFNRYSLGGAMVELRQQVAATHQCTSRGGRLTDNEDCCEAINTSGRDSC